MPEALDAPDPPRRREDVRRHAGPTVELADGGRAHIFVAAPGASSYTYACATPRETMADWLQGCARALSFFGGVPQLIVPDNPRAMIREPEPLRAARQ